MAYKIREVDGTDEEIIETLDELHTLCFVGTAPDIDHSEPVRWWLAFHDNEAVAFGGLAVSVQLYETGYLYRSGVLQQHRGHKLQQRLLRARERAARRCGWKHLVTDTNDNVHSSNNLIAAGYKIYSPTLTWSFGSAIYWHKAL